MNLGVSIRTSQSLSIISLRLFVYLASPMKPKFFFGGR